MDYVRYDLAIIDLNLSGKRSFDFLEKTTLVNLNSKHLVFTSSIRRDYYEKAFKSDIDGYLVKDCMPEDLIYAISTIMNGKTFIDPIFNYIHSNKKSKIDCLTEREKEVLRLIGKGMGNENIAGELFISVSTVKKYVSCILSKMEFNNRVEAALYCQNNYV